MPCEQTIAVLSPKAQQAISAKIINHQLNDPQILAALNGRLASLEISQPFLGTETKFTRLKLNHFSFYPVEITCSHSPRCKIHLPIKNIHLTGRFETRNEKGEVETFLEPLSLDIQGNSSHDRSTPYVEFDVLIHPSPKPSHLLEMDPNSFRFRLPAPSTSLALTPSDQDLTHLTSLLHVLEARYADRQCANCKIAVQNAPQAISPQATDLADRVALVGYQELATELVKLGYAKNQASVDTLLLIHSFFQLWKSLDRDTVRGNEASAEEVHALSAALHDLCSETGCSPDAHQRAMATVGQFAQKKTFSLTDIAEEALGQIAGPPLANAINTAMQEDLFMGRPDLSIPQVNSKQILGMEPMKDTDRPDFPLELTATGFDQNDPTHLLIGISPKGCSPEKPGRLQVMTRPPDELSEKSLPSSAEKAGRSEGAHDLVASLPYSVLNQYLREAFKSSDDKHFHLDNPTHSILLKTLGLQRKIDLDFTEIPQIDEVMDDEIDPVTHRQKTHLEVHFAVKGKYYRFPFMKKKPIFRPEFSPRVALDFHDKEKKLRKKQASDLHKELSFRVITSGPNLGVLEKSDLFNVVTNVIYAVTGRYVFEQILLRTLVVPKLIRDSRLEDPALQDFFLMEMEPTRSGKLVIAADFEPEKAKVLEPIKEKERQKLQSLPGNRKIP